jgi:hypothetical protein
MQNCIFCVRARVGARTYGEDVYTIFKCCIMCFISHKMHIIQLFYHSHSKQYPNYALNYI